MSLRTVDAGSQPGRSFAVRARCLGADGLVVHLSGELDLAAAELLTAVLRNHPGKGLVCLDLAELTFLDCGGLRAIEAARARQLAHGGRLTLVHAGPRIRRVLTLARAEHLLPGEQAPHQRLAR